MRRLRKAIRLLSACGERRDRAQLTAPFPKEQQTEGFHSKNPHPVFFQGGQTPVKQQAPSGLLRQAEGWEKAVPAWTAEVWSPVKVVDGDTPPGHGDTHQDVGTPTRTQGHPSCSFQPRWQPPTSPHSRAVAHSLWLSVSGKQAQSPANGTEWY